MKLKFLTFSVAFLSLSLSLFSMTSPSSGPILNTTSNNLTCYNDSTGSITTTVTNGVGPYTYNWSNGAFINTSSTTSTISNLKAGIYNVHVTDLGTGLTSTDIATITQPPPIQSSISTVDVKCKGNQSGSINLSVSGGTGLFNYVWSNSSTMQDLNNLKANKYIVTISESNNPSCKVKDSAIITEPNYALNNTSIKNDVSCFQASDGSIDISVQGGTPPYSYNWNNSSYFNEDISDLNIGNYNVVVTDANNCILTDNISISQPTQLTNTLSGTNAKCFGANNCQITNTVSGGVKPYSFEWSNSSYKLSVTSQNLSNVVADKYYLTITDKNNCISNDSIEIFSPPQLQSNITGENISAYGGSDGKINLNVSGGVKPYSFVWSNGTSTKNQENIVAGKYIVDIIDFNNCLISDSIILEQPLSAIQINNNTQDVSCFGGNNGWIELLTQGGTPPYNYKWSNGDTISKITNLTAGTYTIEVIDKNGILAFDTIGIFQSKEIDATSKVVNNKCYNEEHGSIDISVTGGTQPYYYEWRNSDYVLSTITEDVYNLKSNKYTVTVSDSLNCTSSFTYIINEPTALIISSEATETPCFGGPNGNIKIDVSGGVLPYSFDWSSGDTTKDLNNIYPGIYTLDVRDSNGCSISIIDTVSQMDSIHFDYLVRDASCSNGEDGKIETFNFSGGNGTYSYQWSTGDTLKKIENISKGTYSFTVKDFMGCTLTKNIIVGENAGECINIPTAFTPNGDGINDTWVIRNVHYYPNCIVKIFNKWGNLVFESDKGYPKEWDGNFNGSPLPAGTYFYIFNSEKKLKPNNGLITIVK
ncbi:MAG: gliding motility-associated C-terminal domain-containing protein [Bacteroidota bacterium]|nr:gliding motility-associated C-terminal domain-containing protein [Bacteroidota bacterium]